MEIGENIQKNTNEIGCLIFFVGDIVPLITKIILFRHLIQKKTIDWILGIHFFRYFMHIIGKPPFSKADFYLIILLFQNSMSGRGQRARSKQQKLST
jgi:hypothetical protein